jgi:putative cell wall-binding protein
MGVEKFQAAVVAYGQNFPDALTGSYLAAVKQAPILLTEPSQDTNVLSYLNNNLVPGGQIYILGGTAAVSQNFEDVARLMGFQVKRLKGAGRYETNLEILKEAGVNRTDEVLIATGKNYADSLSASATGLPMLLVDKELTESQKAFLLTTSCDFVILGGTGAVSAEIADELASMGTVTRVKGASRYGTSVEIAKRYFRNPGAAVLAYAQGFPDGLCGGPLALSIGAPLILTSNESSALADDYVVGITTGAVTGGTARISDETVRNIFDLPANTPIVKP